MQIAVIGLDLAKNVFQVHGIDDAGQAVLKRKLRRSEVLPFFAGLDAALVGIEACHTAHYWGREIAALGHDVRLMPPQFVKRPTMRFVPIKSADQQAVLMLHRTRDLLIRQRSSLISAIRAHFAEFGIVVGQGIRNVERLLALLETAGDQRLPALAAEMLGILAAQLRYVAEQVKEVEVKLLAWHRADETSRRLQSVPGLGPITASAIVATVGDPKQFKSGRQFAAWLGLVPQRSNGRAAAKNVWGASASEEMAISGGCWCTVLVRSLDGGSGLLRTKRHGSSGCWRAGPPMSQRWPTPTSLRASPGRS
jgi:transposase